VLQGARERLGALCVPSIPAMTRASCVTQTYAHGRARVHSRECARARARTRSPTDIRSCTHLCVLLFSYFPSSGANTSTQVGKKTKMNLRPEVLHGSLSAISLRGENLVPGSHTYVTQPPSWTPYPRHSTTNRRRQVSIFSDSDAMIPRRCSSSRSISSFLLVMLAMHLRPAAVVVSLHGVR
jgi:hypothetical protein